MNGTETSSSCYIVIFEKLFIGLAQAEATTIGKCKLHQLSDEDMIIISELNFLEPSAVEQNTFTENSISSLI